MTRRAPRPQKARHVPITDEDWDYLDRAYGPGSERKIGVGPAIRAIVSKHVQIMKAKEQALLDAARTPPTRTA